MIFLNKINVHFIILIKGVSSSFKENLLDILLNSFTKELKRCDCEASTELIFKIIYFLNFLEKRSESRKNNQRQVKLAKTDSKLEKKQAKDDVSESKKEADDSSTTTVTTESDSNNDVKEKSAKNTENDSKNETKSE